MRNLEKIRINTKKINSDFKSAAATGLFKYTLYFLLGVLTASGRIFTTLSPFAVSFIPAVPVQFVPAAAIGACLGYVINFSRDVMTLRYIAGCVIATVGAIAGKSILTKKRAKFYVPISAAIAIFSTGTVISIASGIKFSDILLYLAESAAGGASAYFTFIALNINKEKRCFSRLNAVETAAVLILMSELIISVNPIKIFTVSPAGIIASFIVLCAAAYADERGGSLAGICAGVTLSLADSMSFLAGGFALGGLLGGIFGRKNRFVTTVIFVLTVGIMALPLAPWTQALNVIYDITIGGVLFMLMPQKLAQMVEKCFSVSDSGKYMESQRAALKMRLTSASNSMENVSSCVRSVLKIFERRNEPGVRNYAEEIKTGVCISCERYSYCWGENRDTVRKIIKDTASGVKSGLNEDEIAKNAGMCVNFHALYSKINALYSKFCGEFSSLSSLAMTGNIVADQFSTISDFFSDMAQKIERSEYFDAERSSLINDILTNDMGLNAISSGVFNSNGRIFCELYLALPKDFDSFKLIGKRISSILGIAMEEPVVSEISDSVTCVNICEKTVYSVNYGGYQFVSDGECLCGDTYDCFLDGKGNFIIIISDGMGTGKRAAVDSIMTGAITSALMRSGFDSDSVLNIVNSSMMIRSKEESISTLDICCVDLYTGRCVFYKAGASFSYTTKKKKLIKIEKPSMPIGILRNITFEKSAVTIGDGDKIVLMSDGVSENAKERFREILMSVETTDGEIASKQLAKAALASDDSKKHDDITVVAAILTKNA